MGLRVNSKEVTVDSTKMRDKAEEDFLPGAANMIIGGVRRCDDGSYDPNPLTSRP